MSNTMYIQRLLILLCGIASAVGAAFLNFYVQKFFNFNLLTLSIWVVLPVGAAGMGFLALSGYVYSAVLFNKMLDKFDVYLIMLLSLFAIVFIYYLEYYFYVIQQNLDSTIGLWDYIKYSSENAEYLFKPLKYGPSINVGTIGKMGYVALVLNFIGFLVGGLGAEMSVSTQDKCTPCEKYFKTKKKETFFFNTLEELNECMQKLQDVAGSMELQKYLSTLSKKYNWRFKYKIKIKACPSCHSQLLTGEGYYRMFWQWNDLKNSEIKVALPKSSRI